MPKPMRVTDAIKEQVVAAFVQRIGEMKLLDGKVSFVHDFSFRKGDRATVEFTHLAYSKMMALVDRFDTEIAWHGFVRRSDHDHFVIEDVLVYPQTVTGTTVNTDQEAYDQWLMTIEGDNFNRMKFQGHSHVNMGTSPSATDLQHQAKIISQLGGEGFYIFMIVNKKRQCTMKVYDADNNTLFENDDIDVVVPEEDVQLSKFIEEAKGMVSQVSYPSTNLTTSIKKSSQAPDVKPVHRKNWKATKITKSQKVFDDEEVDDWDEYIFGSRDNGYPYFGHY